MMMETAIYTPRIPVRPRAARHGQLGRIQFMRGCHQQEMAGWPGYWEGLPPMHYATHAVSPCLALVKGEAEYVACFGSGRIADQSGGEVRLAVRRGERPVQSARTSSWRFEVTRSLFETARQYIESFDVYGDKTAFEWTQIEGEEPVVHARREARSGSRCRTTPHLLPEPIRRFTTKGVYDGEHAHLSFMQGGGHGGSHPHLVHEFVSSIVEGRPSFPDVYQSVNWTCAGICAHESAMRGGAMVRLPEFA